MPCEHEWPWRPGPNGYEECLLCGLGRLHEPPCVLSPETVIETKVENGMIVQVHKEWKCTCS